MRRKEYIYEIGEIVNDSLKIVSKTRHGKLNVKAYEVQSIVYPDAPTYVVSENRLNYKRGCSYRCGQRIFEGNSLYSVEWVRPYLTDIEEAKTIAPKSGKKIIVKCPHCDREKSIVVSNLIKQGISCLKCGKGTSYPELFMMAYLEVKGVKYETQVIYDDLPNRRFDFKVKLNGETYLLETHGEQHFSTNKQKKEHSGWNYTKVQKSDVEKKKVL